MGDAARELLDVYDPDGHLIARLERPEGFELPAGMRLVFETEPLIAEPPMSEAESSAIARARAASAIRAGVERGHPDD